MLGRLRLYEDPCSQFQLLAGYTRDATVVMSDMPLSHTEGVTSKLYNQGTV